MATQELNGKIALVTGASSGIGEATARSLAEAGATVILAARRRDRIDALAAELGGDGRAHAFTVDLSERSGVAAFAAQVLERFERVDILINNAGVMHLGLIEGANVAEWQQMLDLNLFAPMALTHALLPSMKAQGGAHVVNISSVAGRTVRAGAGIYNVTKWGLNVFSEALRQEVASANIRVTSIEPGVVATELPERIGNPQAQSQFRIFMQDLEPLEAADIARAILYVVTQPAHVSINELLVRPTKQER